MTLQQFFSEQRQYEFKGDITSSNKRHPPTFTRFFGIVIFCEPSILKRCCVENAQHIYLEDCGAIDIRCIGVDSTLNCLAL